MKLNSSDHSRLESSICPTSIISLPLWISQVFTLFVIIAYLGLPVSGNSFELPDEIVSIQGKNELGDDEATIQLLDEMKRSWQSLQSSWGKRDDSAPSGLSLVPRSADYYDALASEWNPNEMSGFTENVENIKYPVIYASSPNALAAAVVAAASTLTNYQDTTNAITNNPGFEKKSWKNMNVAWGKRRSAVWNKFRGAWGKREPGWNNLKGMWGKRSSGDWRKLQSAWGKRSLQK